MSEADDDAEWLRGCAEYAPSEESEARFKAIAFRLIQQESRLGETVEQRDNAMRELFELNLRLAAAVSGLDSLDQRNTILEVENEKLNERLAGARQGRDDALLRLNSSIEVRQRDDLEGKPLQLSYQDHHSIGATMYDALRGLAFQLYKTRPLDVRDFGAVGDSVVEKRSTNPADHPRIAGYAEDFDDRSE
jgi:hypothetical protein